MSKDNQNNFHVEPFLWAAFGNGGTIAAMFFPILILLFGILLPLGFYEPVALYDNLHAFYENFFGKIIIFFLLAFNLWHACHRIYHATHDFKFHPPLWVKLCIYGFAAVGTVVILSLLF
ncbi:MAG: fumarate reductase subunit D [Gammaproteobacteria bacterium]|nr:MAG: fumarate reductase subunit D [Gammaproteobacteria bacterium]